MLREVLDRIDSRGRVEVDAGLKSYMLRVYGIMTSGIFLTTIVSAVSLNSPSLLYFVGFSAFKWVIFVGILLLGWFAPRIILTGSKSTAYLAFYAYSALWGLFLSPFLYVTIAQGMGANIIRAFFITTAMFGATSIYGYVTKRDLASLSSFIFMVAVGLIISIVVSIFFHNFWFSLLISVVGVLLFSVITAFQTQNIKNTYYSQSSEEVRNRTSIFGAFVLYGSFIGIFIYVLSLLGLASRR